MNNSEMKWLVPTYYKEFKCKGDKCRHNCCHDFGINYGKKDYDRLINLSCDKSLKDRINKTLSSYDEAKGQKNKFCFDDNGFCPMLEKGLCLLHKEFGENYLTDVCKAYPRRFKSINDELIVTCSTSCEKVLEMLYEMDNFAVCYVSLDETPSQKIELPDYSKCLIKKYIEIMENNEYRLLERIAYICQEENKELFDMQRQISMSPVETILYILNSLCWNNGDRKIRNICKNITEKYTNNSAQYKADKIAFTNWFPEYETFFKNIILNSMFIHDYPRVDRRIKTTNAFNGLCIMYGLLMMVSVGSISEKSKKEDLIDTVAVLFRIIDHTSFFYESSIICSFAPILLDL